MRQHATYTYQTNEAHSQPWKTMNTLKMEHRQEVLRMIGNLNFYSLVTTPSADEDLYKQKLQNSYETYIVLRLFSQQDVFLISCSYICGYKSELSFQHHHPHSSVNNSQ